MNKPKRQAAARPHEQEPTPSHPRWLPLWKSFLLAGATALLVSRLMLPTENAAAGETLEIVQFWLGVGVLWAGVHWWYWSPRTGVAIDGWDIAVLTLAGGHLVSALCVLGGGGDARAAVNLLWEWVGLAVSFFLIRQVLGRIKDRTHLTLVFLALAVALASYGVWQHHVWYPRMVREYDERREVVDQLARERPGGAGMEMLRWEERWQRARFALMELGLEESMLELPGRAAFEARLKSSSEPLGRFALTNSFAGWLSVWLIVATAAFGAALLRRNMPAAGLLAACLLLIAYCLLLTKSRTAYVGTAAGLMTLGLALFLQRKTAVPFRRVLLWLIGGAGAAGLLVLLAAFAGGLDRWVLAEAPKSLQYRLEYWRASRQVIAESPLVGVGPGNFRQHYLRYKLPESSEEIADPHNMVLDVWASGGLLALVGLIGTAAGFVVFLLKKSTPEAAVEPTDADFSVWNPAIWAAGLVLLSANVLDLFLDDGLMLLTATFMISAWVLVRFAGPALLDAVEKPAVWGAAGVALLTHLLGAGGIEMPAISQTLLLLLAFGSLAQRPAHLNYSVPDRRGLLVAAGLGGALYCLCQIVATSPVAERRTHLAVAGQPQSLETRLAESRRATGTDSLAADPWEELAWLLTSAAPSRRGEAEQMFAEAVKAQQEAIRRDPYNFSRWRTLGMMYRERYRQTRDKSWAKQAAAALEQSIARYPHRAELLAEWAEALVDAGQHTAAREAARRALEQDAINRRHGHSDKYLSAARQAVLQRVAGD